MKYVVFASTPFGLLFASKLHEEGAEVMVGESTPSDRFADVLEKHPADKLQAALAKTKSKGDYFLVFETPITTALAASLKDYGGFFAPQPEADLGLNHLYRGGKRISSLWIIANSRLGAGNYGPQAAYAQALACLVDPPMVVTKALDEQRKDAADSTVYGPFASLFCHAAVLGSFTWLFEGEPEPDRYGAVVGVFDVPGFISEPRDAVIGGGDTITEAVDAAYEHITDDLFVRPRFDFLSPAYDDSIINRYGEIADEYSLPVFEEEPERAAGLAKEQEALKKERAALEEQRKQMQENYDAQLARVAAEKDEEVRKIREELTTILDGSE